MVAGFTGPPGVGKSSLLSSLVTLLRSDQKTVGMVSVDPSSPFSHGAVLGDRIRLSDHFLDAGRVHPLDVDPRPSGRDLRGHAAGAAGAGRVRQGRAAAGDGRRRPERGGRRHHRRHRRAGADARLRRLRAGAQGRRDGDPRRDRHQQGRPPGGAHHAQRDPLDPVARPRPRRGSRRSSRPRRSAARASTSCGRRCSSTARSSSATAGSSSVGAAASSTRWWRWRWHRRAGGSARPSRATPRCVALLDRVHARELDPLTATREIAERVLKLGG